MSNFVITLEIPALDRLCELFETKTLKTVVDVIEEELRKKLGAAPAEAEPKAEPAKPASEPKPAPEQAKPAQEPKAEPEPAKPAPEPKAEPAPERPAVSLEAVQRAAAQLRDQGKLKAVTDMFGEFGIRKLSDLQGDALQAFADRLRDLGASL